MKYLPQRALAVLSILLTLSGINAYAFGEPSEQPLFDPTKLNATTASDFPNEQLNIINGNLDYLYRDVYVPGPNGMDILGYRNS